MRRPGSAFFHRRVGTTIGGPFVLWVVASILCGGVSSLASETFRFDMGGPPPGYVGSELEWVWHGSPSSPALEGWVPVHEGIMYTADRGYGWENRMRKSFDRNSATNPLYHVADEHPLYDLLRDGIVSRGTTTFRVDLQPGSYRVTVYLGDLGFIWSYADMCVFANDDMVVDGVATERNVKAFTFPVILDEPFLRLRFEVKGHTTEDFPVSIIGVEVASVSQASEVLPATQTFPETLDTEMYRKGWDRFVTGLLKDWEEVKARLIAQGMYEAPADRPVRPAGNLLTQTDYRSVISSGYGDVQYLEIAGVAPDIGPLFPFYREIGIDGFTSEATADFQQLPKGGFSCIPHVGAEYQGARGDDSGWLVVANAAGETQMLKGTWSNSDPELARRKRETWVQYREPQVAIARPDYLFIDEETPPYYNPIRGVHWMGDYSRPAQEHFRRWCVEKGYSDMAEKPMPLPGRTWDFYRYYQFRLETVPRYMRECVAGTELEDLLLVVGNGDMGPMQMNNQGLWPASAAAYGQIPATWAYYEPSAIQATGEVVAAVREFGVPSVMVPGMYYFPESGVDRQHDALLVQIKGAIAVSCLPTQLVIWCSDPILYPPERQKWMEAYYKITRLAHATSGMEPASQVYLYLPESIVFNDLVQGNQAEAQHWRDVTKALHDANLNYRVTYTLDVAPPALVIYAPVVSILTADAAEAIMDFVRRGGTFAFASGTDPESPDGSALGELRTFLGQFEQDDEEDYPAARGGHVLRVAALDAGRVRRWAEQGDVPLNLATDSDAVKSYVYARGDTRCHLFINTDVKGDHPVSLPFVVQNLLGGAIEDSAATVKAGHYLLIQEQ